MHRSIRGALAVAAASALCLAGAAAAGAAPTDQSSILAFIEDNWLGGQRVSSTSFDNLAGSLNDMFNWDHPTFGPVLLSPATGATR